MNFINLAQLWLRNAQTSADFQTPKSSAVLPSDFLISKRASEKEQKGYQKLI